MDKFSWTQMDLKISSAKRLPIYLGVEGYIDGVVQDYSLSIANALEIL